MCSAELEDEGGGRRASSEVPTVLSTWVPESKSVHCRVRRRVLVMKGELVCAGGNERLK